MSERKALTQRGADMDPRTKVSICDFAIFQLTLMIDGLKEGAVFVMSFLAFSMGLLFRSLVGRSGHYSVLVIRTDSMTTGSSGRSSGPVAVVPMERIVSIPSTTLPNTACLPSSQSVAASVTKN